MNKSWPFIIACTAIVAALGFLSTLGKKAPPIPPDSVHRILTAQDACVACHAAGMRAPLKPNHPPKEQCLACHPVAP